METKIVNGDISDKGSTADQIVSAFQSSARCHLINLVSSFQFVSMCPLLIILINRCF